MSMHNFFFGGFEVNDLNRLNKPITLEITKAQIKQQNKLLIDLFEEFDIDPYDFDVDYENESITLYFDNTPENLSNLKFLKFLFDKTIKSMNTLEKGLIKSTNKE